MKYFFLLSSLYLLQACAVGSKCPESVHVKLLNKTGFDGCGWVFQLDDNSYLEPLNLNDFDMKLEEGKNFHVSFTEMENVASICMIGKIVKIKCVSED